MKFINNKYAKALSLVLLIQGCAFYGLASRPERIAFETPLALFPTQISDWRMSQDLPLEKEVMDVLKADDIANREYRSPEHPVPIYLLIEYFKTQRTGQSPHSPKNCLPGAGWEQVLADRPSIKIPGRPDPIVINRFITQHGLDKSVVLYWYQSHGRVVASEFSSKFWLVADAIRYHRSDVSMIKVVVPVAGNDVDGASKIATDFVTVLFPVVSTSIPI